MSLRHVKSQNCLKVSVYTIASRGDFILRIKVKAFNITFVVHSESSVFSMDEKKKTLKTFKAIILVLFAVNVSVHMQNVYVEVRCSAH